MRPIPVWVEAPFLRLLAPWIAGIAIQWYTATDYIYPLIALSCFTAAYIFFHLLPHSLQFEWHHLRGYLLQLISVTMGMLVTWKADDRNHPSWWGHSYQNGNSFIAIVNEVPQKKERTVKVSVTVSAIMQEDTLLPCRGQLLLYIDQQDQRSTTIRYGDELIIRQTPQPIRSSGNPGAFDYAQYAAFKGWHYQMYLRAEHWRPTGAWKGNIGKAWLIRTRDRTLQFISSKVPGKQEAAIAEALLIGYTADLDKELLQAYSNTGVVHIIAISGMHLGLIYGLLLWLLTHTPFLSRQRRMQALLILGALWLFALMAGGSSSVIRSAVMFSILTIGRFFFNRSSTFNALAGSAWLMLAVHPFYLLDIGFQLSYTAVIGIVLFQKPIYSLLYIPSKIPDLIWQAISITLAAQIFTFPICLLYFHQFPLYFLFSNLIAVPLSTLVLYACIALLAISWHTVASCYTGQLIQWLIHKMNRFILWVNNWPLGLWDQIPANVFTTFVLYIVIISAAVWLLKRNFSMLLIALSACCVFLGIHAWQAWQSADQQHIVVYNIPKHQAVDFIEGNQYFFVGDSIPDPRFHLKPARTRFRVKRTGQPLPSFQICQNVYQLGNRRLVIIDSSSAHNIPAIPLTTDLLLLSHSPDIDVETLMTGYRFRWLIIDASNALWKIEQWKQSCERLHLRCHAVSEKGAFLSD